MELIVIDEQRMKIMLTAEDVAEYKIDILTLDAEDEKTKRILYDILDRATSKAGAERARDQAFVQIFPSKDGGCEMYVTKYSQLSDDRAGEVKAVPIPTRGRTSRVKKRLVYKFSSLGDLLLASRALVARGYRDNSDAYIQKSKESIYLVIYESDEVDVTVTLEYADPVFFGGVNAYICEHCTAICEGDAVGRLAALC